MKAVITAGGEGMGLRPLTCSRPKPMIKIMGKPVIGYVIELLIKNGFEEIAVTTRYRSADIEDYINDCDLQNTDVYCVEEDNALGTAGSVKNATKSWHEPFVVISGDCICDIELSKVMLFHKSINADVTVVCSAVEDTGKFGIVNLNRNGSVESLIEKPDWSHTSSNLANTGIYVIEPAALELIPDNSPFDFEDDFLPALINKKKRLYGYQTESYWCDLGEIKDLRACIHDVMSHRVKISFPESKNGIFSNGKVPEGEYNIVPPVYIGKNVEIGHNCTIGPFTIIEDNVTVGAATRIKKSVIMQNSHIGGNCDVIGAVIGESCVLKRNTVCLEGSCVSDGCVIDSGSTVSNNVFVWPEKKVSYRSVLTGNLREGKNEFDLICSDSIQGNTFSEISCERCCRLGEALGSSSCGGKVAIGYDSTKESKALAMAVLSGLISSGSKIYDFGECVESQMHFFVSFCSLDSGIFISADKNIAKIKLFGEYGLPLSCKAEREIESRYKRSDFRRACGIKINDIRDMSAVADVYYGLLLTFSGDSIAGASATVKSLNPLLVETVQKCFYLLGTKNIGLPEFSIDGTGNNVTAKDENGKFVSNEIMVLACCIDAFEHGKNVCVPFEAPSSIEKMAEKYGRTVTRTGGSTMTGFTEETGMLARRCLWAYDGLALIFTVMGIMKRKNITLSELVTQLPQYNICSKTISCSIPHSRLAEVLDVRVDRDSQGLRKPVGSGFLTVLRQGGGRHIKIIAEAETIEAAQEICIDTEKKINYDTIDNMTQ